MKSLIPTHSSFFRFYFGCPSRTFHSYIVSLFSGCLIIEQVIDHTILVQSYKGVDSGKSKVISLGFTLNSSHHILPSVPSHLCTISYLLSPHTFCSLHLTFTSTFVLLYTFHIITQLSRRVNQPSSFHS